MKQLISRKKIYFPSETEKKHTQHSEWAQNWLEIKHLALAKIDSNLRVVFRYFSMNSKL